jgi:hypothetical protein
MKTRVVPFVAPVAVLLLFFAGQPRLVAQQKLAPGTLLEPQTRLEQLLASPDQLLVKDYYRVEDRLGSSTTMQAMVVTAAGQPGARLRGVRVDVRDRSTQGERASTSFLDFEELEPLSRALAAMTERSETWKGAGQETQVTETEFMSIGGFSIGLRQDWQAQHAFVSSGFLDPVRVRIEISDFYKAKGMVDQALGILRSKQVN